MPKPVGSNDALTASMYAASDLDREESGAAEKAPATMPLPELPERAADKVKNPMGRDRAIRLSFLATGN
jgi:hypothetical protein